MAVADISHLETFFCLLMSVNGSSALSKHLAQYFTSNAKQRLEMHILSCTVSLCISLLFNHLKAIKVLLKRLN